MSSRFWYTGLSGAKICFAINGISPIASFTEAFRIFLFNVMRFGDASGLLFCTDKVHFPAVYAHVSRKRPLNAVHQSGICYLDPHAQDFYISFSNCWGEMVEESHQRFLHCLPSVSDITSWKIESDGLGSGQRMTGSDLDSLLTHLGLTR